MLPLWLDKVICVSPEKIEMLPVRSRPTHQKTKGKPLTGLPPVSYQRIKGFFAWPGGIGRTSVLSYIATPGRAIPGSFWACFIFLKPLWTWITNNNISLFDNLSTFFLKKIIISAFRLRDICWKFYGRKLSAFCGQLLYKLKINFVCILSPAILILLQFFVT